jgi:hypothetical protein
VFGVPVIIGAGVPILAGITFLPASGNISALYRIYEDVLTYSYKVWIDTSTGVDTTGLTRDLTYITPSGIVFTIDQTHTGTGLIHWSNTMKHYAPSGWWGLDTTYNDSSGNAFNGTVTGAPTAIAAPGLLPGVSGTDAARDFSGAAQYVTIGDVAALNSGLFTIHSIVRPDTLPTSGNYRIIYYAGGTGNNATWLSLANYSGNVRWGFRVWNGTTFQEISGTTLPVTGTTYRVSATYDGITMKLYVNGILENSTTFVGPAALTGTKYIGVRGPADAYFWDGGLDEIAYLGYPISAADALYLSNQARNIL